MLHKHCQSLWFFIVKSTLVSFLLCFVCGVEWEFAPALVGGRIEGRWENQRVAGSTSLHVKWQAASQKWPSRLATRDGLSSSPLEGKWRLTEALAPRPGLSMAAGGKEWGGWGVGRWWKKVTAVALVLVLCGGVDVGAFWMFSEVNGYPHPSPQSTPLSSLDRSSS